MTLSFALSTVYKDKVDKPPFNSPTEMTVIVPGFHTNYYPKAESTGSQLDDNGLYVDRVTSLPFVN